MTSSSRTAARFHDVIGLPEATRETATEARIDPNGHMNIVHYLQLTSWAIAARSQDVGLGSYLDAPSGDLTVFTAEQHLTYLHELRLGDDFSVHSRFIARSDKALHAMAFVVNRSAEEVAFVLESTTVCVSVQTRRAHVFAAHVLPGLDAELAADSARPWDPPLAGPMGVRR